MCQYKIYTCVNIHGGNFGIIFAEDLVLVAKHGCSLVADPQRGIPLRRLSYRLCISGHGGFTANHQGVFLCCCGSRRKGPFRTRVSRGSAVKCRHHWRRILHCRSRSRRGLFSQMSGGEGGSNRCLYILRVTEKEDLICWIKRVDSGVSTLQVREEQRRIGRLHSSGLAGSRVGAHCYGSIQVAILRYNCN